LKVLASLDAVAERYRTTAAQVAIAWFKGRPGLAAPIASATTFEQLAELAQAAVLVLDAEAVAQLDSASAS
jgi:aryl-alcohol dehydrogenase-like predicted oxidoreductase